MTKEIVLSPEERNFFLILKETAFINPFSQRRQELNRKIAGIKNLSGEQLLRKMISTVTDRMKQIKTEERDDFRLYTGEDREMMRIALLFDIYHRFVDDFEAFIKEQIKIGDTPCPVPFSSKILTLLKQRGFSTEQSLHYFAFLYQLKRAVFFY